MITLLIPMPPSANHLFSTVPRQTRRGLKMVRVKSPEYTAWATPIAQLWRLQRVRVTAYPVRVRLVVTYGVGLNHARDLDNMLKPTLDTLTAAGVIKGDSIAYVHGVAVDLEPGDSSRPATARVEIRGPGD